MTAETKKIVIAGSAVILVAATAAIIAHSSKKWSSGKNRPDRDMAFDPKKQKRLAFVGTEGHANVRSAPHLPELSNVQQGSLGALDWSLSLFGYQTATATFSNKLGQVNSGEIGEIVSESEGERGFWWYKVKLRSPLKGKKYGYVREDVVSVKIVNR